MEASGNNKFIVNIQTNGSNAQSVEVTPKETTDGLPYYICKTDQYEVQLRKDDQWEIIWGKLSIEKAVAIGSEIDKHLLRKTE